MGLFVVTPCYNSAATLSTTLDSVLAQRELLTRYVVVDGGSTDATLAILVAYEPRFGSKLSWRSQPDDGIYDAMNKGIRQCLPDARPDDLIGVINSDDAYTPDAFAVVGAAAAKNCRADLLYGQARFMDVQGRELANTYAVMHPLDKAALSDDMPLAHPATFVRARTYRELGLYDTRYKIAADFDFVCRVVEAGKETVYLPAELALFRQGGASLQAEDLSYREAIRVRVAHGASPFFEWLRYYKRRLFARLYAFLCFVPGFKNLYGRSRGN